jgi:cytochrome oxidase assembly protein ShyY1
MTLFVACFLPLTISLGLWQLRRAEEKESLAVRFIESQAELPVVADADAPDLPPFTRVRLRGRFDPERYVLVDNRTRAGRVGYEVIALFETDGGRSYFLNRGWVAAPARRDELPHVAVPEGRTSVTGTIWRDLGLGFGRADVEAAGGWPLRVQHFEPRTVAGWIEGAVPVEIRLDPGMPGALETRYQAPLFQPERHRGYAVQWFGLAIALVLLYVHFGFRRSVAS